MPSYKWSKLDYLQVGQYSEYYAKMEFTTYGFDVFTSEIDDHGIDFIVKVRDGLYYEIQVKAARLDRTSYVFAKKSKFSIDNSNLYMVLVLLNEDESPNIYLIPSGAWIVENDLFRNRDYIGKKSVPEWGLNISKKNLHLLEEYRLDRQIVNLQ
ncbi:MAG: DUF4365 domain-containing protein [Clostridia bacterium]|nr:DUF4365 domain-containing protein [Clostridia bacterium]